MRKVAVVVFTTKGGSVEDVCDNCEHEHELDPDLDDHVVICLEDYLYNHIVTTCPYCGTTSSIFTNAPGVHEAVFTNHLRAFLVGEAPPQLRDEYARAKRREAVEEAVTEELEARWVE